MKFRFEFVSKCLAHILIDSLAFVMLEIILYRKYRETLIIISLVKESILCFLGQHNLWQVQFVIGTFSQGCDIVHKPVQTIKKLL